MAETFERSLANSFPRIERVLVAACFSIVFVVQRRRGFARFAFALALGIISVIVCSAMGISTPNNRRAAAGGTGPPSPRKKR